MFAHLVYMLNEMNKYIRSCLYCGTFLGKIDVMCEDCWRKLRNRKSYGVQKKSPHYFPHFHLFTWLKRSDEIIRPLVFALKMAPAKDFYSALAKEFVLSPLYQELMKNKNKLLFVPAPARKYGDCDHAYALAESLAAQFSGEVWLGLKRGSSQSQKSLDRARRKSTKLQFAEAKYKKEVRGFKNVTVIFVDDIVTSGSTAQAARQLFDNTHQFCVCSIFYRPLENEEIMQK